MIEAAVMGYGTVGAGVVQVLTMNSEAIARRVGEQVHVKYVLDLRDFPGTPVEKIVTHDVNDILSDPEVKIVVETMGGLKPAYDFTKKALLAGKNVCTSNKELVAEHGVELMEIARDMSVNYLFEASCGGGIPIIRVINTSLTAEEIEEVTGILNGTTNYILTSMADEGKGFETALKEAQQKGYAELHPEADVEGYDACRKIAILSSLAYGKHISYKNVDTEGITKVDKTDVEYADKLGVRIKLLATSRREKEGIWAIVAPMMIGDENPLTAVSGVMNAVMVKGNAVGTTMYYGSGAGSLPTASAVVGDVIDCCKHLHVNIKSDYSAASLELMPAGDVARPFFVRFAGTEEEAEALFGQLHDVVRLDDVENEFGFLTETMAEKDFKEKAASTDKVIKWFRRGKKEEE